MHYNDLGKKISEKAKIERFGNRDARFFLWDRGPEAHENLATVHPSPHHTTPHHPPSTNFAISLAYNEYDLNAIVYRVTHLS